MLDIRYSEAIVEVLDILKHTKIDDVKKIPKSFMEFLENNVSKTYISKLDHTKSIKEMNLKPETEAILGLIYIKYWANEESKLEFKNKMKQNELIYQKELREKYNVDNLFEKKEYKKIENEPVMIVQKSVIQKMIDKIKSVFRR